MEVIYHCKPELINQNVKVMFDIMEEDDRLKLLDNFHATPKSLFIIHNTVSNFIDDKIYNNKYTPVYTSKILTNKLFYINWYKQFPTIFIPDTTNLYGTCLLTNIDQDDRTMNIMWSISRPFLNINTLLYMKTIIYKINKKLEKLLNYIKPLNSLNFIVFGSCVLGLYNAISINENRPGDVDILSINDVNILSGIKDQVNSNYIDIFTELNNFEKMKTMVNSHNITYNIEDFIRKKRSNDISTNILVDKSDLIYKNKFFMYYKGIKFLTLKIELCRHQSNTDRNLLDLFRCLTLYPHLRNFTGLDKDIRIPV
jgi:hypothetical protein